MKIRLLLKDQSLTLTLDDNPSARDQFARLPLRLDLKDYARTEKIAYLDQPLSPKAAPSGYAPAAGDLTYYAPWGNLALFYKNFGYASGLIRLGRLDEGLELLAAADDETVRLEACD